MDKSEWPIVLGNINMLIHKLAIGEGDIRSRFIGISDDIILIPYQSLPKKFRIEWEEIYKELSKSGPIRRVDNGAILVDEINNTMCHTRRRTASIIAERIIEFASALSLFIKYEQHVEAI